MGLGYWYMGRTKLACTPMCTTLEPHSHYLKMDSVKLLLSTPICCTPREIYLIYTAVEGAE